MRTRVLALAVVCSSLVGCDHATKAWAEHALKQAAPMHLWRGLLDLRYAANDDVAFSLLRWIPDGPRYFVILAMLLPATAGLVWLWRQAQTRMQRAAVTMILAGALGNFIDRLARGYVVDFIHIHRWPVFNVADVLIVAGIALWLWPRRRAARADPGVGA